jgi:hypothetical protein
VWFGVPKGLIADVTLSCSPAIGPSYEYKTRIKFNYPTPGYYTWSGMHFNG